MLPSPASLQRAPFAVERVSYASTHQSHKRPHKIIGVLPAFNAERTLATTLADVPPGCLDELILVDDGSRDRTVQVAREIGLTVIEHPRNRGYGASQKTCYRHALQRGADIVVMIHPD